MSALILGTLFLAALLLCVRFSERLLATLAAVLVCASLGLLLAGFLTGGRGAPVDLSRIQGFAALAAFMLGSSLFILGRVIVPSLNRSGPVLNVPFKPVATDRPRGGLTGRRTRTPTPIPPARRTLNPTAGDLRFQDYELMDRIGVGGMGSVYRARRHSDGKIVALKVPQEKYLADAKFVKRFYREAEVLKRFNHPNIVRVYDYRMQDPEHYIAMEFLDGQSLESVLEDRQLDFTESTQMLRAMADALRHIHMQNVVHRDIKPANVMVLKGAFQDGRLREGGIKLMDFGIAVGKVLTRLTMTGARVGTPIYMAPEQAKGNRVDARSDVYSLGLLAYEMVTGQTAFKGSYEAVVHQQVFEAPKPPKQVRLEVPGKLSDLILHMIEKDPAARPTLDEVIARLDAGVMADEVFDDPHALAMSVQEKRGTVRLLDLRGKLRVSLRDLHGGEGGVPAVPSALAGDAQGQLYAALTEYRHGKTGALIRKYAPDGQELLAFGAYGLGEGELLSPVSLACTGDEVFILDAEACHVVVFGADGTYRRRFGERGQGMGRFEKPRTVVASPSGEVYVLDSGNNEVQRFTAQGEYISRYAFRMDRTSETLRQLDGLGMDGQGAVYIVDSVARKVRKIEADGTPGLTFALEPLIGEAHDALWLLQVAPDGTVFVARQGGQVLRSFSSVGDQLTQLDMYAPVQALAMLQRRPA